MGCDCSTFDSVAAENVVSTNEFSVYLSDSRFCWARARLRQSSIRRFLCHARKIS